MYLGFNPSLFHINPVKCFHLESFSVHRWVLAKLLGWLAHQTTHMAMVVIHQSSQQMQLSFLKWNYSVVEFTLKFHWNVTHSFLKGLILPFIHVNFYPLYYWDKWCKFYDMNASTTDDAKIMYLFGILLVSKGCVLFCFLILICHLGYWHKSTMNA